MLKITISSDETWDETTEEFIPAVEPVEVHLEHSLVSLARWESKWKKPYLSSELSREETIDYIRCMCIDDIDPEIFNHISDSNIKQVADYIADPMTATWFTDDKTKTPSGPHKNGRMKGEIITAEIVYYWMISAQIPVEFENWHLNRLLTLVRVIGEKNNPPKKMSKSDLTRKYAQLNAQRRAALHTKG